MVRMDADAIPAVISVKKELPPIQAQDSDSVFVQLPVQSYAEYQGCGFWTPLTESLQHHPQRWALGTLAAALLLLILLLASIIPATRHHTHAPQFTVRPTVAATGASWIDISLQLDQRGVVSWVLVKNSSLEELVNGTSASLSALLQSGDVSGETIYQASAEAASLESASSCPQPGLAEMAVACGWAPVAAAGQDTVVSVLSVAGSAAASCTGGDAQAACARCPTLEDGTAYTALLVAATPSGKAVSSVLAVSGITGGSSVNVDSVEPPFVDNTTATAFTLHFKLKTAGTLYFAVAYDQLLAPFGTSGSVVFSNGVASSTAVVNALPSSFQGGIVANGSVAVEQPGQWLNVSVQPPCVSSQLCAQRLYGLQSSTAYSVYLVAMDSQGGIDSAPSVVSFATPAATSAPALLPGTAPTNVTAVGFVMKVTTDVAGGVYWSLVTAKAGPSAADPGIGPGDWREVQGLGGGSSRRRLHTAPMPAVGASGRHLVASTQAADHGYLVQPSCPIVNVTCSASASSVFGGVASLSASFDTVATGCVAVPAAGQSTTLPAFQGLQNNTLYYLLLSTEDQLVPTPNRMQLPTMYGIRTVDLAAPRIACGFPQATNISSSGFALSAYLTKPAQAVFYAVLPGEQAATAPTTQEVLAGTGADGGTAAAAGKLAQTGWLPWEGPGGSGDPRKFWANVTGLQGGSNYTAFLAVSQDGNTPATQGGAAALSGVLTPNWAPPTFTALNASNITVDEDQGMFALQLDAGIDMPGQVYYALYRCVTGCVRDTTAPHQYTTHLHLTCPPPQQSIFQATPTESP